MSRGSMRDQGRTRARPASAGGRHAGGRRWRTAAVGLAATLAAGVPVAAQQCPNGLPTFGSLGVGEFECVGGSCAINMRTGDPYAHSFSSEPRLRDIDGWADVLHDGDVLIAVDDRLITTAEGGRRLGSLKPGQDVRLRLRRDGREIDARLTTRSSCELPRLQVTSGVREAWSHLLNADRMSAGLDTSIAGYGGYADDWTWTAPAFAADSSGLSFTFSTLHGDMTGFADRSGLWTPGRPPVEFGVELACGECGWRGHAGDMSFVTEVFPVVASIVKGGPADTAGLAVGDRLLAVGGHPITSSEAGRLLGSLEPGEAVTLEVRRGDRVLEIALAPRAPGERRQRW